MRTSRSSTTRAKASSVSRATRAAARERGVDDRQSKSIAPERARARARARPALDRSRARGARRAGLGLLLALSRQMGDASMSATASMPGMPEMPGHAGNGRRRRAGIARSFALAALMWWTMMVGMMVPSAAPMILLFGTCSAASSRPRARSCGSALFTAGYLAAWARIQRAGGRRADRADEARAPRADGPHRHDPARRRARRARGRYQLTPLKNACLRRCRSPAEFLSSHWRPGNAGALRMGSSTGSIA